LEYTAKRGETIEESKKLQGSWGFYSKGRGDFAELDIIIKLIKCMIQFSARNSIMGRSNLAKATLINFGLDQHNAIPGMKPPITYY